MASVGTITHIPSTSGGVGDTISVNHTCDANSTRLAIACGWGNSGGSGADSIAATYNGVALTRRASDHASNWSNVEYFTMDNPPTGLPLSASCNYTGGLNPSMMVGTAVAVLGSKTGVMPSGSASGAADPAFFSVAGSANGDLMIGATFTDGSTGSLITDSPAVEIDTEEDIFNDSDYECSKDTTVASAGWGISWTLGTTDNWAAAGESIQTLAAQAIVPPPPQCGRSFYVMP